MEPAVPDQEVVAHISVNYAVDSPVSATLIRRGFNDHYLIEGPGGRQIFRIFHREKLHISSVAEMQFELDLLRHLSRSGVSVAPPIGTGNHELICPVAGTGLWGALFEFAPGEKVSHLTERQAKNFGGVVARMHVESDKFVSTLPRYHLDVYGLLDGPLQLAAELVGEELVRPDRSEFAYLRSEVESLGKAPGTYGIIHGDCHLPNLHLADDRPTLFDFDHCAYGWRAYDLASCFVSLQESADAVSELSTTEGTAWRAFLSGYSAVRQPSPAEIQAIPAFCCLRAVWDIGNVLAKAHAGSTAEAEALADSIPVILDFSVAGIPPGE